MFISTKEVTDKNNLMERNEFHERVPLGPNPDREAINVQKSKTQSDSGMIEIPTPTGFPVPGPYGFPNMGPNSQMPFFGQPYPPMYPYMPRPIEPFGITSATLGIVAMAVFWLSVFPEIYGTIFYAAVITISIIGIIFGAYSYSSKFRRNVPGLVGLILSIIAIVLSSIIWIFSHMRYDYFYYDIIWILSKQFFSGF